MITWLKTHSGPHTSSILYFEKTCLHTHTRTRAQSSSFPQHKLTRLLLHYPYKLQQRKRQRLAKAFIPLIPNRIWPLSPRAWPSSSATPSSCLTYTLTIVPLSHTHIHTHTRLYLSLHPFRSSLTHSPAVLYDVKLCSISRQNTHSAMDSATCNLQRDAPGALNKIKKDTEKN